jgi:hypothetical protein
VVVSHLVDNKPHGLVVFGGDGGNFFDGGWDVGRVVGEEQAQRALKMR